MAVLSVNPTTTGLIDITPVVVQIKTDDTLTAVLVPGYLNSSIKVYGYVYSNLQMALVYTKDQGPVWLRVVISGTNTSLVAPSEPGVVTSVGITGSEFTITNSPITSSGNIGLALNVVSGDKGGTGVANVNKTITLGGNLSTVGAFNTILNMSGATNVNFPTTGTLATTSQIPTGAALTKVDDTNVTLTLGGSPTTALINATSITAGWTGTLSNARGGLGAAITADNGAIYYSTGSNAALLASTATAGQIIRSGANAAPSWSTTTYPATNAINTLLYASAANVMSALATANSAALVTNSSGVPTWSGSMTNGQLIIGSTSSTPTAATLTAGLGVSITNAAGSITIAAPGASTWVDQTTTPVTMVANTSYSANNAGLVTLNMPATANFGDIFRVAGQGAGGWKIQMNTSQIANTSTGSTTSAGSLSSTSRYDCVTLVCTVANTTFTILNSMGNISLA